MRCDSMRCDAMRFVAMESDFNFKCFWDLGLVLVDVASDRDMLNCAAQVLVRGVFRHLVPAIGQEEIEWISVGLACVPLCCCIHEL